MNGKENLMTIKRHALMMIAALAFMMIFLIPATMTSVHAEGEITHEKVGEWGGQEATVFKYNGMKCFCVESKNSGPSEALGQEISERFTTDNMVKSHGVALKAMRRKGLSLLPAYSAIFIQKEPIMKPIMTILKV